MNIRSLAAMGLLSAGVLACSVDKSGDEGESSGGSTASTGATQQPTTEGPTGTESGGETGSESGDETGTAEGSSPCIDTPTVLAIDQSSMGGFSGEQVLMDKVGVRMTTLTFASEPTTLAEAWKGKALPLTVELRHAGGEVRWIDSEPDPDYQNPGTEGPVADCTDRMEIDVKIDFVSEAEEFDEQRDAVLTATAVERAELQAKLTPPGLTGSLDLTTIYTPADPATTITALWIFGTWQGDQAGGSVMHEINVGGDDGFAGFGPLASWGDPIAP